MVFQNYALYPHMTVEQNLGFGLKLRKTPKTEIRRRVAEVASILGLEDLLKRKPAALSGGQRQRVAMGRAMVREPQAFLMDEPLSNLDAKLRVQMRAELARLRDRLKTTTVYVTHDQVEAMTLGDRVAVMRDGAAAAGRHAADALPRPGQPVRRSLHRLAVDEPRRGADLERPRPLRRLRSAAPRRPWARELRGRNADPRHPPVRLRGRVAGAQPELPVIEVVVDVIEELGSEVHLLFTVAAAPVAADVRRAAADAEKGDDVLLVHDDDHANRTPFTARVSAATTGRPGQTVKLTVDPQAFHFFDPSDGASLARRVEAGVA